MVCIASSQMRFPLRSSLSINGSKDNTVARALAPTEPIILLLKSSLFKDFKEDITGEIVFNSSPCRLELLALNSSSVLRKGRICSSIDEPPGFSLTLRTFKLTKFDKDGCKRWKSLFDKLLELKFSTWSIRKFDNTQLRPSVAEPSIPVLARLSIFKLWTAFGNEHNSHIELPIWLESRISSSKGAHEKRVGPRLLKSCGVIVLEDKERTFKLERNEYCWISSISIEKFPP